MKTKPETEAKKNSYWSVDEQAYFLDGGAWGVNKQLVNVYMGIEQEVLKKHPAR